MHRSVLLGLVAVGLLAGCGRQVPAPQPDPQPTPPKPPIIQVVDGGDNKGDPAPRSIDTLLAGVAEPTKQDQYDSSLLSALNLLADKKQAEALAALEAAKAVQDTDQIQHEIDRLKNTMARKAAAESTLENIRAVLDDGRPEEASRLATDALQQYGGSDAAEELLKLKRQADALVSAQTDAADRKKKARADVDAALDAKNLRAAAVAMEQALQLGDDDDLKKQLDELHQRLQTYDDNRRRAAELRRDAATLDDALAALQEAQKAWDTPEVQQQLDEYSLAVQTRRERLSVADFEVRGDVGMPDAGRGLADELLPSFKSRFDLVERGQLGKVIEELKLEAHDLGDEHNRAEVGRLAKVRYLVVGSVTRLGGLTVNARLVDVRSGLVVQTARVSAGSPDDLLAQLPQLATVLMMNDDQKMAYQQQLAKQAEDVKTVDVTPLPPPPEVRPDDQPPPPPLVTTTPVAPPLGDVKPDEFDNLPPPPAADQPPAVVVVDPPDSRVKLRLRHLAIEIGDNLFRRGRFLEANAQFQLALNLGGDSDDIQVRIDRCQPFLPPPPEPVVVFVPPPPPMPRIAILDFPVIGDPDVVSPVLGPWTADALAPYFSPPYEVVDRGEVCWYMNRMGLTVRDVLTDPVARRWLGRALHVRFFVFGTIRETHSFVVTTHLVDAEWGYEVGSGRVHVHNAFELKVRLGELAGQTLLDPAERKRRQREAEEAEEEAVRLRKLAEADRLHQLRDCDNPDVVVLEIQNIGDKIDVGIAVDILGRMRKRRPDSIEINVLFQRFNDRGRRADFDEARRREFERQQEAIAEAQARQRDLARAAEAARIQAEREAALRQDDDRRQRDHQREQAYTQLRLQAQLALQQRQFDAAIQMYQSALDLHRTDEAFRDLAVARARAEEANRARAADDAAAREALLRQQREDELARARLQLGEERRRREDAERAARDAQAARDQAAYQRLLDDGQRFLAKEQYDPAISSFQTARQLRRTDEVERLLSQALVEQARAVAEKKGDKERKDLERRLAEEKARREQAEAEAARNRDLYQAALAQAQKALNDKHYDVAVAKYEEAGKLYNTDVVLTGLRQAKSLQTEDLDREKADQAKRDAEAKKAADFKRLKDNGRAALETKPPQYDRAVKMLNQANQLIPGDIDVLTALGKAEQAQAQDAARAKRTAETAQQDAAFQQFLKGGKDNLAAKQYPAAVNALREAVRLKPGDPDATAALQLAEKGLADAKLSAEQEAQAAKNREVYQKAMSDGRLALAAKQYDAATAAFQAAQKALPDDQTAAAFLKDVAKAKGDADAAVAEAVRKREAEQKKAAAAQKALAQGRALLAVNNLEAAGKAIAEAADAAPNDPEVRKAQDDLGKALTAAKAEAEARKKRADQFQALVKKGADAQAAQRYDDAVNAYAQASQLMPDDATVKDLLAKAAKARADAKAVADETVTKKAAEERAAKVKQLVADARKAIDSKQFDDAGKLLVDAHKLAPDDPAVLKAQDDLAKSNKAAGAEVEKLKKQQADYQLAMDAGRAALRKNNYEGAVNSYTEALRILPGDKDATTALKDAQTAKATADAEVKRKAEEARRRDDFAKAMGQGRTAMTAKLYADAVKAFNDALQLQPGDPTATRALRDANQAVADAARADADAKKREAAYADAMKAGRAAMTGKKYDDAVKSFTEAARLLPDDKDAAAGLKEAKAAVAALGDRTKHEADFADAMKAGRAAMTAKKYADAVKSFTEAGKLFPDDKTAAAALKEARAALDGDTKRQEDFTLLMTQGRKASDEKRYDDAAKAFADALKLAPDDPAAAKAYKTAQSAADAAKTDAEKKKRDADYAAAMKAGQAALAAKKYDDAVKSFTEAGKLYPGDKDAAAALLKAKAGMDSDSDVKKREAAYADAMKSGRAAMTGKKYADAVKSFTEAARIMPGDKDAADALKAAQDAAAADDKKKQDEAKRLDDFKKLMALGQKAMDAKRFDDAVKNFADALKLEPDDAVAARAYKDAQQAQTAATTDADKKKREADYAAAMTTARAALTGKKYAEAVKGYQEALRLMPGDKEAAAGLKAAQDAAAADDKKKQDETKRQEEFNSLMVQGRKALTAGRYDEALKAFGDAAKLQPDDPAAAKAYKDAQQALDAAKADADKKKREADYAAAMAAGRAAMTAKRYDDAVKSFTDAGRILPGDKDAAASLKAAQDAAAADAKKKMEEAKRRDDFNRVLGQGQASLTAKRYDEAAKAFADALKMEPTDPTAAKGLRDAQQALDAVKAEAAKAEADRRKREAEYADAMKAGRAAVAAKKYDDAVKAFTEAGKVFPGDKDAASGLKDAQAALDADAKRRADDAKRQDDFNRLMAQGQKAAAALKYADAINAYSGALADVPGDPKATAGLQNAQFQLHVTQAQGLAAAKKFPDAVKEYQEALKIFPADPTATAALKRAQDGKP